MRAAYKVEFDAQHMHVHLRSEMHVSCKDDAYLNMGDDIWQVQEGPSC